jgi:hypothetical protein
MAYGGQNDNPTPIDYLPAITVEVAFAPTDINSLTQTWTDCTQYVRRFTANRGRQHFLDRNEASTFNVLFYNRDGFFTNITKNGTNKQLRARLPIRANAALTGPLDSVTVVGTVATAHLPYTDLSSTQAGDTITIQGSSNDAMNASWVITGVTHTTITFTVPSGIGNSTNGLLTIYYPVFWGLIDNIQEQATDSLNSDLSVQASDYLKNLSLRYLSAPSLYGSYVTPAGFTGLTLTTPGAKNWYRFDTASTFAGTANDQLNYSDSQPQSGKNGAVIGATSQNQQGVCLYDDRTCLDLTAGTGNPSGYLSLAPTGNICLDFWVLGQNLAGQTLTSGLTIIGGSADGDLYVTGNGQLGWNGDSTVCPQVVNDGQWHHIAIVADGTSASVVLGVDGQWTTTTSGGPIVQVGGLQIGPMSGYIDQVVITGVPASGSWTSTVQAQMAARAAVGSLLMGDSTPGDMIAQALIIAGFGSIATTGTTAYYSVPRYQVNEVNYSNSDFNVQNPSYGVMHVQGYTSPVNGSTGLDVITTACDTEIGDFFQDNLGIFNFHTRAYPYSPSRSTALYSFGDQLGSQYWYNSENLKLTWDDADIWTTVKVSVQNGTTQTYENTAAEATQGYSTLTKSTNATTSDQALATAQYLGYLYQEGLPRVASMELKARTDGGSQLPAMLAAYLNNRVHFTRTMPNAYPSVGGDMIIEAITDEFDAEAGDWTTTFTLDPYPLRITTIDRKHYMIADDYAYGTTDGTNVAI